MDEPFNTFIELQKIDAERLAFEKQLALYPPMLAKLDAEEKDARDALADLGREREAARIEQRRFEREMASLEDKIAHFEKQREFITNEKQFKTLEHEIAHVREQVSGVEDRILELMTRLDELEAKRPEVEQRAESVSADAARERARIEEQIATKKEALARLNAERDALREAVAPPDLARFDDISRRHPGSVLVGLDGKACGGCHTTLTPTIRVELGQGKTPRCDHCGRFMTTKHIG